MNQSNPCDLTCPPLHGIFFFFPHDPATLQLLETFSSGVSTGEEGAEAAAWAGREEPQHDTAIYWFSCTHKRQVLRRHNKRCGSERRYRRDVASCAMHLECACRESVFVFYFFILLFFFIVDDMKRVVLLSRGKAVQ